MDEIDAIGDLTHGGLLARAVEPPAGDGVADADGHTHESACLNCGTPLIGSHCHGCGQRGHVHKTLGAFFHDLLHGVLHFEGKTWRTLPLLALRPGELTRRYIAGERARFVSPMALFLFSVFLMFAVFQIAGIGAPTDFENTNIVTADGETTRLEALREARQEMGEGNPAAAALDAQIALLEQQAEPASDGGPTGDVRVEYSGAEFARERIGGLKTGWSVIDHGIEKWQKNPGLMAYKLQANSYKFSWLLIPLSIPFVWLLFAWRRKFGPYDHAVFVTYSLSFMTLLFVTLTILGAVGVNQDALAIAFGLIPLLHIYKQLKGAYSLSRFSALWRTAALSGFIVIILLLFVSQLLLLGAVG